MSESSKFKEEIKITEVKPVKGMMLLVTFSTGEKRLFDVTRLTGSAFEPLKDENVFMHPTLFHGVISWNNGEIDISPEMVYKESYEYNECNGQLVI